MSFDPRYDPSLEAEEIIEQALRAHEWEKDKTCHVFQWRDPTCRLSWYTLMDALLIMIHDSA